MIKQNLWNTAAKCGAILGGVLALSGILEVRMTLAGGMAMYGLIVLEYVVFAALHYYLLHRFTRNQSRLYSQEEGFTFGQAYGYLLTISAFAGVLVGIVQYLHLHLIVGYSAYVDKVVSNVSVMLAGQGGIPSSVSGLYGEVLAQLQNTPEPSMIATVWSGVFASLLFGVLFGLIIAGVLSRAPRPFDSEPTQE